MASVFFDESPTTRDCVLVGPELALIKGLKLCYKCSLRSLCNPPSAGEGFNNTNNQPSSDLLACVCEKFDFAKSR